MIIVLEEFEIYNSLKNLKIYWTGEKTHKKIASEHKF